MERTAEPQFGGGFQSAEREFGGMFQAKSASRNMSENLINSALNNQLISSILKQS
jgi:hypothetical protein